MQDYIVAEPDLNDIKELARLERDCFPLDAWSEKMFLEALDNGSCKMLALKDLHLSKIVAYSVLYIAADQADLANIAVDTNLRGRGLGSLMLQKSLCDKALCNVSQVFLEVRESNLIARHLYEKNGFVTIGNRKKYYRHPTEDAIIMVCNLK